MPFDTLATAAVTDELRLRLDGGRIQKIVQPSGAAIGLNIYADNSSHWLLLSADPRHARAQLSAHRLAKAFPEPSPFVMLLRKYLDSTRITSIEQVPRERVIVFSCGPPEAHVRLVCEVMGKHSNVILISEKDHVLGALKAVPPYQSRVRPILPGRPYMLPPIQGRDERLYPPGFRLDPYTEGEECATTMHQVPLGTSIREALLGLLVGISPFQADQILLRAGVSGLCTEDTVNAALRPAAELYSLYTTRKWHPYTFRDSRGRLDFAPYCPVDMSEVQEASSMGSAMETTIESAESHDALGSVRREIITKVEQELSGVERRRLSLNTGLAASADADEIMQRGQLILAYQYQIQASDSALDLPEFELRIPLEPRLTPVENAERAFRRYRKLRDAKSRIPPLLIEATREKERLQDLLTFAQLAQSEVELRAIARDIAPDVGKPVHPRQRQKDRKGPPKYMLDGYTVVVGRNARENEEVTFRIAGRNDLWLHARERTGAHVIIKEGTAETPEDVVAGAAQIAAYFSEGREDTAVDVVVTPVRNVRKIPGGPPGRVTYRTFRTIRVEPRLPD